MNINQWYSKHCSDVYNQVDKMVDNSLAVTAANDSSSAARYHIIDMNLHHFLKNISITARTELAKRTLTDNYINQTADHHPDYISRLGEFLEVEGGQLIEKNKDESLYPILAGFHTGPFWSAFLELVKRRRNIVTVTQPTAENDTDGRLAFMRSSFEVFKTRFGSDATLQILDPRSNSFFRKLVRAIKDDRQLVFYLDGFVGETAKVSEIKDINLMLLDAELVVKTNIERVIRKIGARCVSFHARRGAGVNRILTFEELVLASGKDEIGKMTRSLFDTLERYLRECPSQWEGWCYFDRYFSDRYVAQLRERERRFVGRRVFTMSEGESPIVMDKATLKTYHLKKKLAAS